MLEVRETPGSTFGVFDTEKNDFFRSPDDVILTRDSLAGANALLQRLQRDQATAQEKRPLLHTYKGMRRDIIIVACLIIALVLVKTCL